MLYYSRNLLTKMTTKFIRRFEKNLDVLASALAGECNLEEEYPQLYRQVYEFYNLSGVSLFGEPDDDYEVILTQLNKDLTS